MTRNLRFCVSGAVCLATFAGCGRIEDNCWDCPDSGVVSDDSWGIGHHKPRVFTISASVDPEGRGSVVATAVEGRARCDGSTCDARRGATVSLQAIPTTAAPFGFVGWSGCSDSTSDTITLTDIRADAECVAHFLPTTVLVSAFVVNMYRGTALMSVDGVSCGMYTCAVPYGTVVTLEAPSTYGYQFLNWSCSESTESTERVIMISTASPEFQITCYAIMDPITFEVTWEVDPSAPGGSIRMAGSGPDIVCTESSCQVVRGAGIGLEAVPDADYVFVGWSGCSSSTDPLLRLTDVAEPMHCQARFAPAP